MLWQEEDLAKNLQFFSISSDGRVTLWTMSKNELQYTDVMELKLVGLQKEGDADEETSLCGLAGGCCIDFNKQSDHLFVVGRVQGMSHADDVSDAMVFFRGKVASVNMPTV